MKKMLLVVYCALPMALFGQVIQNGGFESWNTQTVDMLDQWQNSNLESMGKIGVSTAFKTTDSHAGLAIKLVTTTVGTDTVAGYFANTEDNPLDGIGGQPFNGLPTAIHFFCKYSMVGNDSSVLVVIFKKNGIVLSQDFFLINSGPIQNTYVQKTFPLSLSSMADSVVVAVASSNMVSAQQNMRPGTTLYIDDITFSGAGAMPSIYNGDFEHWTTQTYNWLNWWNWSHEGLVQKTADAHSGSSAVKIISAPSGGNINMGSISNFSRDQFTGIFDGGVPYTLMVDTLVGYYKYYNLSGDHAVIDILLKNNGVQVFYNGHLELNPVNQYTKFTIPLAPFMQPDTFRIEFDASSYPFLNIGAGSEFYLDDVYLTSETSQGVNEHDPSSFNAWPNPVRDKLYVDCRTALPASTLFRVTTLDGKLLFESDAPEMLNDETISFDAGWLVPGIYSFEVRSAGSVHTGRFVRM